MSKGANVGELAARTNANRRRFSAAAMMPVCHAPGARTARREGVRPRRTCALAKRTLMISGVFFEDAVCDLYVRLVDIEESI